MLRRASRRYSSKNPQTEHYQNEVFFLRPWRGPLPKRRAVPITLAAYLPDRATEGKEDGRCTQALKDNSEIKVRPNSDIPIERDRNFGRSWWDLFPTGPRSGGRACAKTSHSSLTPKQTEPSPSPPQGNTPAPSITPPPSPFTGPSFAEIMRRPARPMPPYPKAVDHSRGRAQN